MSTLKDRMDALLLGNASFRSVDLSGNVVPLCTPLEQKDASGGATEIKKLNDTIDAVARGFEEFKRTNDERIAAAAKGTVDPLIEEKLQRITQDILKNTELKDQLQGLSDKHGGMTQRIDDLEATLKRVGTGGNGDGEGEFTLKGAEEFERATAQLQGRKYDDRATPDVKAYENYAKAFSMYLRKGGDDPRAGAGVLNADELKALSAGVLADGGYMLTPAQSNRIIGTIRETSPMRALATVEQIGTDTLEFLVDQGEAGMGWVGETASRPETATPQLSKRQIVTGEQYANPAITQKLLDDATMNPEQWLANKVADKFGRTEATAFINGDGVNKPRGVFNYGAGTGLNQLPRFNLSTGGVAGVVNPDRLIDMVFALKDPYASRAAWLANRFVVPALMKLKTADGAYIWQPGLTQGAPATLLGRPMRFAADMATPAAGTESIAIGDWAAGYTIVDRIGIRTLRDPYTNKPYVHFYSTRRVGGAVVDFEAILIGVLAV